MSLLAWMNPNPQDRNSTRIILIDSSGNTHSVYVRDSTKPSRCWYLTPSDPIDNGLLGLVKSTRIGSISPNVPTGQEIRLNGVEARVADTYCGVHITVSFPNGEAMKTRLIGPLAMIDEDHTGVWQSETSEPVSTGHYLVWRPAGELDSAANVVPNGVVFSSSGDYSLLLWSWTADQSTNLDCLDGNTKLAPVALWRNANGLRVWKFVVRLTSDVASIKFRLTSGNMRQGCRLSVSKLTTP